MPYHDPWRDAVNEAKRLLQSGMTPERVMERTRLPKSVIDRIAPPIIAIREAEQAVERERERMLREEYPCPLCSKGHGVAVGGTIVGFLDGSVRRIGESDDVRPEGSPFFRPCWAHCSNRRCVARLMFPRDTEEEALKAFVAGEWIEPHPFVGLSDGSLWEWTRAGLASRVSRLLDDYSTEQVKLLGFNPVAVDELANRKALQAARYDPAAWDTTLMCPKCGSKGRYRKAVNPITHSKETWRCWWRVGCPKCGTRTVNAFPTREQAQAAFESGDLQRKPEKEGEEKE